MAKDKAAKARVDDEAATATLTKTRKQTNPEGTQILRQGGTLSHLMGNPTRDLRPVPRFEANKNKGPGVLTKMGTSSMPTSAPASCAWRVSSRRRGLKSPAPRRSHRDAPGGPQTWCSGYVSVFGGREYLGVLDTGAIISIVAKNILPCGDLKNILPTAAIRMGDGHVVHSCGDCEVEVPMGSRSIAHWFYEMDTEAFEFVLGTDFFGEHSRSLSLTQQAPYVLQVDHGDG